MEEINFEDFLRVLIRTGTILEATLNTKARNPAYILRIDFGPLGIKTSSAQITENYQPDELVGLQISAVLNFPAKRVAGFKSEVLVLGAYSEEKGKKNKHYPSRYKGGVPIKDCEINCFYYYHDKSHSMGAFRLSYHKKYTSTILFIKIKIN